MLNRIDDILHKIEEENSIASRWIANDEYYQAAKYTVDYNKLKNQLLQIRKGVVKRSFLLGLKSKYSGIYFHSMQC